ncbi:MAG: NAD(P)H-dependent oxidoreductase [Bacteroidota bacterium]
MPKKILVIPGQPQRRSYGGALALAQAYIEGARAAGAELQELYLGELQFNACANAGQSSPTALEPEQARAQETIRWADHLVFVYPIWWGTIPALLKGLIERAFTEGFAVKVRGDSPWWDRLLKGRSARLIVTMNTPSFIYRWRFGRPGQNTMKKTILEFCGVKPARITEIGPARNSTDAKRQKWPGQACDLGKQLA